MNREQWTQKRSQYDALQGAMESYFACAREIRSDAKAGNVKAGGRLAAPSGTAAEGDKVVIFGRPPTAIVVGR